MTDEQFATRTPTAAENWDSSPAVVPGGSADTALIVVDMQNDFGHPDGSLFVTGGASIVGSVNDEIERTAAGGGTIVLTQDWHPASTPHFIDDGGVWPTHCVAGTWGAELVDGVDPNRRASAVIRKGTNGEDGYSAFAMREPGGDIDIPTGLAGLLRERAHRAGRRGRARHGCLRRCDRDQRCGRRVRHDRGAVGRDPRRSPRCRHHGSGAR